MKNVILTLLLLTGLSSCSKVEEIVSESVNSAKEKAQEKAKETFQETVNTQFDKLVNAENIQLEHVFPRENNLGIERAVGKKMTLPNGTLIYVFKYRTAEKDLLLENLVKQSTTDETRSDVDFQKVDGAMIIEKVTFFQKFLPSNTFDLSFLEDIKNDKNIEYYKIKRFPHSSTIIYNPKTDMVYHFVEVKK